MTFVDDIRRLDCSVHRLRSFGLTISAVGILATAWLWWQEVGWWPWLLAAALLLILAALTAPVILRPLYRVWMTIALVLGWIMTRVLLALVFYLVLTPTALIARVCGKKFLDLGPDRGHDSYWVAREESDQDRREQYERQF